MHRRRRSTRIGSSNSVDGLLRWLREAAASRASVDLSDCRSRRGAERSVRYWKVSLLLAHPPCWRHLVRLLSAGTRSTGSRKTMKRNISRGVVPRSSGRLWLLTSFSTPSSSTAFPFPLRACPLAPARPLEITLLDERAPEARCRPTFSRWSSVQERIDAMSCSISNRFESPRGVVMKVISTFDTSRLQERTPCQ